MRVGTGCQTCSDRLRIACGHRWMYREHGKGSKRVVIESEVLLWAVLAILLIADVIFWVLSVGSAASEEASFRLLAVAVGLLLPLLAVAIQVTGTYFVEVSTQYTWGTAAGLWFLGLWVYGVVFGGRVTRAND